MRFFTLYIIITVFLSLSANSQDSNKKLTDLIATANQEYEYRNYYGAAKLFEKAYKINSKMYDMAWLAAESYRLDNDYLKAAFYYKIIIFNSLEKYPEALFYMGLMEKSNEEYVKAQYYFNRYHKNHQNENDNLYVKRAEKEILACEYALKLKNNPVGVRVERFDTTVNTVYSEYAPFISDSLLYFSSIRPNNDSSDIHQSKIYYSVIKDSIFSKSKTLDSTINMKLYDVANPFICNDGKTMFFSAMKVNYGSESHIYKSEKHSDKWSVPEKLPEKINSQGYNSIHPFVIEREKSNNILLWSSNRPEGEGGYDIWFCEIMPDKSYGLIKNLGRPIVKDKTLLAFMDTTSKINSPLDEISPFFNVNDTSLYFSSNWYQGMGGFDIFSVEWDFRNFKEVQNLGYPINSAQNDFYYKVFDDEAYSVFTSNRKGSLALKHQSCCNDLYFYKKDIVIDQEQLIVEKIERITQTTKLLVPIELYFHNDRPVPRSWDTVTNINYEQSYHDYIALIDEYQKEYSKGLRREEKDFAVEEINNFFDEFVEFNYNKLLEFANSMKELLAEGQKIEITIKGYTSPLNTAEYNVNLSKRRISSLVNFFHEYDDGHFKKYIDKGMITFEFAAFGKTLADSSVSADPNDLRNSVYSPAASKERRIEIIAISVEDNRKIVDE